MEILKIYQQSQNLNRDIVIMWIKAHCGFIHNEQVDRLAKDSINNYTREIMEIPYTDVVPIYKYKVRKKWEQIYESAYSNKVTNYFLIHPKLPIKHWHNKLHVPRNFFTTITRLKFNHARFPSHLCKINIRNDNLCACGQVGDINHIFFNCELHENHTKILVRKLLELNFYLPLNINNILESENFEAYKAIYNFTRSANVCL